MENVDVAERAYRRGSRSRPVQRRGARSGSRKRSQRVVTAVRPMRIFAPRTNFAKQSGSPSAPRSQSWHHETVQPDCPLQSSRPCTTRRICAGRLYEAETVRGSTWARRSRSPAKRRQGVRTRACRGIHASASVVGDRSSSAGTAAAPGPDACRCRAARSRSLRSASASLSCSISLPSFPGCETRSDAEPREAAIPQYVRVARVWPYRSLDRRCLASSTAEAEGRGRRAGEDGGRARRARPSRDRARNRIRRSRSD